MRISDLAHAGIIPARAAAGKINDFWVDIGIITKRKKFATMLRGIWLEEQ